MKAMIETTQELSGSYKIEEIDSSVRVLDKQGAEVGKIVAAKDCVSAQSLAKKLANPSLAETWIKIEDKTAEGYSGELFFLPKTSKTDVEEVTLYASGSLIITPHLSSSLIDVGEALKNKTSLPTFFIKKGTDNRGEEQLYLAKNKSDSIDHAHAFIRNVPPELMNAMERDGTQLFQTIGLANEKKQMIEVDENTNIQMMPRKKANIVGTWTPDAPANNDELMEKAKDVVREGRARWSELEEKLNYMIGENVPEKVIAEVLKLIKPCTNDWVGLVPKPQSVFRQSGRQGELTRCLAYRCRGMNLRLVGGKGSGKNTLAETIDWIFGRPQYRLQGNAELDKLDLLGSPTLKNGTMEYQLSDMIRCLMAGGDVVLDEGNTIRPEVADILHSLTDGSRSVQIPGYGLAKMAADSTITLTMNEGYMGTTKMNEATVDRFTPIQMEQPKSISNILREAVPEANDDDIKNANSVYVQVLSKIQGGETSQSTLEPDCLTIRGFIDALRSSDLLGLKQALLDNVADKPQDLYSRSELREIVLAICL